jgi:hypothetical protein
LRVNLADIVVDLDHRTLLPVAKITEILLPLEQAVEELTVDISGQNTLDKQQLYLLSSDLDGRAPFLNKLTLSHLLKASADGELKDIDHVVSVARTLLALGAAVPSLAYLDDPTMGRLRTLPAASMRFIGRLADDSGEVRPVSIWDLGVAQNLTNRVWRGWDELRRRGFPRRRLFSRLLG